MAFSSLFASSTSRYEFPVCHEDFVTPKILPCGHVVCQMCVLNWVREKDDQATCPLCRYRILQPPLTCRSRSSGRLSALLLQERSLTVDGFGGVGGFRERQKRKLEVRAFPTDCYTEDLVASKKILRGPHVCSLCKAKKSTSNNNTDDAASAATHYCLQCALKLCSGCKRSHQLIPSTKFHALEKLGGLTLTAQRLARARQVACPDHSDRPAEVYCRSHKRLVCVLCGTTRLGACTSEKKTVAEMLTEVKPELDRGVKSLKTKAAELTTQVIFARARASVARQNVSDTFHAIQQMLENQRQKLESDIQADEQTLTSSLTSVEETRAILTQNASTLGHLVSSASGSTLLQMLETLRRRLDQLEKQAKEEYQKAKGIRPTRFKNNEWKLDRLRACVAELCSEMGES